MNDALLGLVILMLALVGAARILVMVARALARVFRRKTSLAAFKRHETNDRADYEREVARRVHALKRGARL